MPSRNNLSRTGTKPVMETNTIEESRRTGKQKHGSLKTCTRILGVLLILALICGAVMDGYALHYRSHYTVRFYQETS